MKQPTENTRETQSNKSTDSLELRAASRTYEFLGKTPEGAAHFAQRYVKEADDCQYWLGVPDAADVPTMVLILEAARNLCGMRHGDAQHLLSLATERLQRTNQWR